MFLFFGISELWYKACLKNVIGFSGLSRPSGRRFSRMSWHFEKTWIILLNLLNAFVIKGKAPPENPATLLEILWPMSITSSFMVLFMLQCFSTRVEFWISFCLLKWSALGSACECSQLCSSLHSEQQCYLFLTSELGELFFYRDSCVGSRSISFGSCEDR